MLAFAIRLYTFYPRFYDGNYWPFGPLTEIGWPPSDPFGLGNLFLPLLHIKWRCSHCQSLYLRPALCQRAMSPWPFENLCTCAHPRSGIKRYGPKGSIRLRLRAPMGLPLWLTPKLKEWLQKRWLPSTTGTLMMSARMGHQFRFFLEMRTINSSCSLWALPTS